MDLKIKPVDPNEAVQLFTLYKKVAAIQDGIIRNENEVNEAYISEFLTNSVNNGLILGAYMGDKIVGEIHAYTPNIYAFQHLLTDLTVVVDPKHQGKGIGRKLFEHFLKTVESSHQHILRVELFTREHNKRNVLFYESLGFINEGRQKDKIFVNSTVLETPLHMAWFNPNYKMR